MAVEVHKKICLWYVFMTINLLCLINHFKITAKLIDFKVISAYNQCDQSASSYQNKNAVSFSLPKKKVLCKKNKQVSVNLEINIFNLPS